MNTSRKPTIADAVHAQTGFVNPAGPKAQIERDKFDAAKILLAAGMKKATIARVLGVSPTTVARMVKA